MSEPSLADAAAATTEADARFNDAGLGADVAHGDAAAEPVDGPAEAPPPAPPTRLDPAFGQGGVVKLNPTDDNEAATFVAPLPDGRTFVCLGARLGAARLKADGSLDPSFGSSGITSPVAGVFAHNCAFDANGNVVMAGQRPSPKGEETRQVMARFLPEGQPDPTFGTDGRLELLTRTEAFGFYDLSVDDSGRIVAVGAGASDQTEVEVMRFLPDGRRDVGFGTDGLVVVRRGTEDVGFFVDTLPGGSVVYGGVSALGGIRGHDCHVGRLTADGVADASYGENGVTLADVRRPGKIGFEENYAYRGRIDPQGRLVVVGEIRAVGPGISDMALTRFLPNGQIDTSFGTAGTALVDGGGENDSLLDLTFQPDGKIVATGVIRSRMTVSGVNRDMIVVRVLEDGSPDSAFGTNGRFFVDMSVDDLGRAVAIDASGALLVAGRTLAGTSSAAFVVRILP